MLAIVGFAAPLAYFSPLEEWPMVVFATVASCGIFVLILLIKKSDISAFLNSLFFCGIGVVIFIMLIPSFQVNGRFSAAEMLLAAIITLASWAIGCISLRWDDRIATARRSQAEKMDAETKPS
jgi:hypothetical protein